MSRQNSQPTAWANYHGHSHFCDGQGSPETYVKKAIELGMKSLGISSHAPVPFATDWNMEAARLPEYIQILSLLKQKYASQIEVLSSMEVDYIPNMAGPSHHRIVSAGLDYVVGSVHFVEAFADGTPFSIDDSTEDFCRGIDEIFGGDIQKAVERYFELQRKMLEDESPQILGHMDKIRLHNRNRFFFDEKAPWYVQQVHDTMNLAKEKGTVVEINTKYYDRAGISFPSQDHYGWMARNNIPVTLSSDAHHPARLLSGFTEMSGLLKRSRIKKLWQFDNGKFSARKFDENGIIW